MKYMSPQAQAYPSIWLGHVRGALAPLRISLAVVFLLLAQLSALAQQGGGTDGILHSTGAPGIHTALPAGRTGAAEHYQTAGSLTPKYKAATRNKRRGTSPARLATQIDTLELDPVLGFYDDFANTLQKPDTNRWKNLGGVFINNTLAVKPINHQFATFDGLNARGNPYDTVRVGVAGRCDTLNSLPLNLGLFSAIQTDSVWLSFNYQVGGPFVQMMPEQFDSLLLFFRSPVDTNWTRVWFTLGDTTPTEGATAFRKAYVRVGPEWHTYGFEFRFINYGSRNGTGDLFSIDNVYLNDGRDSLDLRGSKRFRDLAASQIIKGPLFPYTQLPRLHLNELGSAGAGTVLSDTVQAVFTTANNFTAQAQEVPYSIRATVQDSASGTMLETVDDPFTFSSSFEGLGYFPFLRPFRTPESRVTVGLPITALTQLRSFANTANPASTALITQFTLPNADPQNNPYRANDTIRLHSPLAATYAYDDGSAELIRWTGGNNARLAQRFYNYKPDTLKAIKMLFPRTLQNLAPGRIIQFNLFVWRELLPIRNNSPDRFYINISVQLTPAAIRDGYTTFPFAVPVLIDTGNYYIGWQQGTGVDQEVRIGVDINNSPGQNVYYNVTGNWQLDTTDNHPLCIRPVFTQTPRPLTVQESTQSLQRVYPNPASAGSVITLGGPTQSVRWYSSTGQLLHTQQQDLPTTAWLVPALPTGIYFVHTSSGKAIRVRVE